MPNANSEVMRVIALLSRILLPFVFFNYSELTVFEMIVNVGECCLIYCVTAPFNNMRTLKFEAQPTNGFFAAVNQVFGGSSKLPTTAEHCFVI